MNRSTEQTQICFSNFYGYFIDVMSLWTEAIPLAFFSKNAAGVNAGYEVIQIALAPGLNLVKSVCLGNQLVTATSAEAAAANEALIGAIDEALDDLAMAVDFEASVDALLPVVPYLVDSVNQSIHALATGQTLLDNTAVQGMN